MRAFTFWCGVLGASIFVTTAILGSLQFETYSHLSQYISESYAMGTPYGETLRFFGYLPSGILLTIFAFLAIKLLPASQLSKIGFTGFGIFYGLVTALTAFFPCDAGCNREWINPSNSQIIHNLIGFATYIFVPPSLILIGIASRSWHNAKLFTTISLLSAIIAGTGVSILLSEPHAAYAGLYQRIIESAILLWVVVCAFQIRKSGNTIKA